MAQWHNAMVNDALSTLPAWRGGLMVAALDLRSRGRGFNSRPFHFHVMALDNKLFTLFKHICFCNQAAIYGGLRWHSTIYLCCVVYFVLIFFLLCFVTFVFLFLKIYICWPKDVTLYR